MQAEAHGSAAAAAQDPDSRDQRMDALAARQPALAISPGDRSPTTPTTSPPSSPNNTASSGSCAPPPRPPLPATYVKVYARHTGGLVRFYKDGYTDLRGRFDYVTLSTDDLDRVERFTILVASDDAGATVLEADPPPR